MYGNACSLKDVDILKIQSPRHSVGGPYVVVYKDVDQRWAIVALDWDGRPRLGIRWFWGNSGNPLSSGYPTWFVIPKPLTRNMLNGLAINHNIACKVNNYLCGKISGDELKTALTSVSVGSDSVDDGAE